MSTECQINRTCMHEQNQVKHSCNQCSALSSIKIWPKHYKNFSQLSDRTLKLKYHRVSFKYM